MLNNITFKTDLGEIITVEEISILFDSITRKYKTELVSLSIFPMINQLKQDVIKKATKQRNSELSQLLTEIANRKQEIKLNMWKKLATIGESKKKLQASNNKISDLEQINYEEEQIISVYEECIRSLENKEKKIMSGRYSKIDRIQPLLNKKTLKRQLEGLKERLLFISAAHDNCFAEFEKVLDELIAKTIITSNNMVHKGTNSIIKEKITIDNYENGMLIENIEYTYDSEDEKMHYKHSHPNKDYYCYEPNLNNPDDELIYQLLIQNKYEDGTINSLLISND